MPQKLNAQDARGLAPVFLKTKAATVSSAKEGEKYGYRKKVAAGQDRYMEDYTNLNYGKGEQYDQRRDNKIQGGCN